MLRLLLVIVSMVTLTACGTSKMVKEMENQDSVLVFGYAYKAEGPLDFDWIQLRRNGAKDPIVRIHTDSEGLFYGENLPFGSYQIHRYGWGGEPVGETGVFGVAGNSIRFPKEGNPTTVQGRKPGVVFMGSFRYTFTDTGFFSSGDRSFDKVASPSEKEVLQKLLPYTKGTRWEARAQKRLAELR